MTQLDSDAPVDFPDAAVVAATWDDLLLPAGETPPEIEPGDVNPQTYETGPGTDGLEPINLLLVGPPSAAAAGPQLPPRPPYLPDVIFQTGATPLLLSRRRGSDSSLWLVRMNLAAVEALLSLVQAQGPLLETDLPKIDLLDTLEQLSADPASAAAVDFSVELLSEAWEPSGPTSITRLPLARFLDSEGVAVRQESRIALDRLAQTDPTSPGQPESEIYYALVTSSSDGVSRALTLRPYEPNRGTSLGQGARLSAARGEDTGALVFSTLQIPRVGAASPQLDGIQPLGAAAADPSASGNDSEKRFPPGNSQEDDLQEPVLLGTSEADYPGEAVLFSSSEADYPGEVILFSTSEEDYPGEPVLLSNNEDNDLGDPVLFSNNEDNDLEDPVLLGNSGPAGAGLRISLELSSAARFANLYGIYRVTGPEGALLDDQGQPVHPGDSRYAGLALRASFAEGRNSLLWEAPRYSTSRFEAACNWLEAAPQPGDSLATVLEPGGFYQHFILSSPTEQARQEVIRSLRDPAGPGAAVLDRTWFALAGANRDQSPHAIGLDPEQSGCLSLGFEDQPGLGDSDFNDVIASWTVQTGTFGIGSTTLVDLQADRIPDLAVGSQAGSTSTVVIVATDDGSGQEPWLPFGADDTSGVQLESGDVNGDGFDDLVAIRQSLPSGQAGSSCAEVMVLLGGDSPLPENRKTLRFQAFADAASGPLSLAVRDLDLDGCAEVVLTATAADPQRTSLPLEVWSAASGSFQLSSTAGLPALDRLDPRHGYGVALGDLDGDGSVELVLGDLQGGSLFVGSVAPGGDGTPGSGIPATVLEPYGRDFRQGIRPTVISAQQTLLQRPPGLAANSLPWSLGPTRGRQQALLGGLGTVGALIVQSADALDPNPAQVPLSWLQPGGPDDVPLVLLPWDSRSGAPVFSSAGVSYLNPGAAAHKPAQLQGEPLPILLSAAAGSSSVELLSGPPASGSGPWQPISDSANTIAASASQAGWSHDWSSSNTSGISGGSGSADPAAAREQFNQVSTELVSYKPPFNIDLNPLDLADPGLLLSDLQEHVTTFIDSVVTPWNAKNLIGTNPTPWGPGAPGSVNDPFGDTNPPNPTRFTPGFAPVLSPNGLAETTNLTEQFQQRLISTAMASMGINYQHHYSPLWYDPNSWTSPETPTPQLSWLTSPEGRQTQGLDCSNFSSWNYNMAFGFWLESSVSNQAVQTTVNVDWLTGTSKTLTSTPVAASPADIYLINPSDPTNSPKRSKDQVIDYLNKILKPGDLLYIAGKPLIDDPTPSTAPEVTHVITWVNDNSEGAPLRFVELNDGGSAPPNPAFVIDSTGSESRNFQHQAYPNGVQIRQFDDTAWYVTNIVSINRWLTSENVLTMAHSLPGLAAPLPV
jgi:hypothetical protein